MQDFNIMDSVVEQLCKSMKENPSRWEITTHTLIDRHNNVKYWKGFTDEPIVSVWNGSSIERVFNEEQGYKLKEAMFLMADFNGTKAQKKILNSFKSSETSAKVWWKFWQ